MIHRSSSRTSELNINKPFRPIKQNMQMNPITERLNKFSNGDIITLQNSYPQQHMTSVEEPEYALHNPGITRKMVLEKYKSTIALLY